MNDFSVLKSMPVVDERSVDTRLIDAVTQIFSDITRYPVEIIDPQADLENDLGIDSVKFGEIFSALRERYALPGPDVMKTLPRERFRSVAGIADIIAEFGVAGPKVAAPAVMPVVAAVSTAAAPPPIAAAPISPAPVAAASVVPAPAVVVPVPAGPSMLAEVTQVFVDMTRYPVELLDADADFENDLGIDSVKLGEIFAGLRDKYQLPPPEVLREKWKPNSIRTIRGIVEGIASLQTVTAPAVVAPRPAPPPIPAAVVTPEASAKFAGKIALITGSGRGLGRDLALHLGRLGATVLVNSFHSRDAGEATAAEIRQADRKSVV